MRMVARGRDLATGAAHEARVLDAAEIVITASIRREILAITSTPAIAGLDQLLGVRAGGASRTTLNQALGELRGSIAFQLLDDFAGASLVAGWVWSRWVTDWGAELQRSGAKANSGRGGQMVGVCTGFAPGSSALGVDGGANHATQSACEVGALENPADPNGWHLMTLQGGAPGMRRARRLDLWRDGETLHADLGFQDSGAAPGGGRVAVHEYRVCAVIDAAAMTLVSIDADPRILPYRECPGAVANVARMIGHHVADFRADVLSTLAGTLGCTHLNDVLRSLADVPALAHQLE